VIGGEASPAALGFELSSLEADAVLAQLASQAGKKYQGCSATLVGDRVVVAAGHCVIMNQSSWLNGDPPQVITADALEYVVGQDVNKPLCSLAVASVHLHPQIEVTQLYGIQHDVSVSILKQSVTKSCPHVVPMQINAEPLTADFIGKQVLTGGFGSTDGTYNFSPVRYWSLLEVQQKDQFVIAVGSINKGFPTFGDSSAGARGARSGPALLLLLLLVPLRRRQG